MMDPLLCLILIFATGIMLDNIIILIIITVIWGKKKLKKIDMEIKKKKHIMDQEKISKRYPKTTQKASKRHPKIYIIYFFYQILYS